MRYLLVVVAFFLMQAAQAQNITIENVKVSVKANSAAEAQAQALDQAHRLAFQRLVAENFPENMSSLPNQEELINMVNDFSIDREKTTPTSYTASLTFQFDKPRVTAWAQQFQQGKQSLPVSYSNSFPHTMGTPLKVMASYTTHPEWNIIRKTLEDSPGVQELTIFTLSPQNAMMKISYTGDITQLAQELFQKGFRLSQNEEGWVVSPMAHALR